MHDPWGRPSHEQDGRPLQQRIGSQSNEQEPMFKASAEVRITGGKAMIGVATFAASALTLISTLAGDHGKVTAGTPTISPPSPTTTTEMLPQDNGQPLVTGRRYPGGLPAPAPKRRDPVQYPTPTPSPTPAPPIRGSAGEKPNTQTGPHDPSSSQTPPSPSPTAPSTTTPSPEPEHPAGVLDLVGGILGSVFGPEN